MKRILVCYTDNVESRFLLSKDFLGLFDEYALIDVATPASKSHLKDFVGLSSCNIHHVLQEPLLLDKVRLRLGYILFHSSRYFSPINAVKLSSLWSKSDRVDFSNKLVKIIQSVLWKINEVNCLLNFCSSYETIVFPRQDSAYNYQIYRRFAGPKTKLVCFVRNVDFWELKGWETHKFDRLVDLDGLRWNLSINMSDLPVDSFSLKSILKYSREKDSILFATSQEKFNNSDLTQLEYAKYLLELSRSRGMFLIVRRHHEDLTDYSVLGDDVIVQTDNTIDYGTSRRAIYLYDKKLLNQFYDTILRSHCVLTLTSTIVLDADYFGIPSAFVSVGKNNVFSRLHLAYLIENGIPLLSSFDQIKAFVNDIH